MRSSLLSDLSCLDLLEICGSSRVAADVSYFTQSSVYRAAVGVAADFGFDLQKSDGGYRCVSNLDVLAGFRAASRLLRSRGGQPLRCLADYRSLSYFNALSVPVCLVPQPSLGWQNPLRFLDAALLDILVARASELFPLLGIPVGALLVGQWYYRGDCAFLALNREPVRLVVDARHPLLQLSCVTPRELIEFPSPCVSDDLIPGFNELWTPHGLCSTRLRRRVMQPGFWERLAFDQDMVVPATANSLAAAAALGIGPLHVLPYRTGIVDHDVLVVPLALMREPAVQSLIQAITAAYQLVCPTVQAIHTVSPARMPSFAARRAPAAQQSHLVANRA